MELTNVQIQRHISELPENIRRAVTEFNWAGEVMSIAQKHNIQIDEIEIFRQETLKVILGLVPADAYEKSLISLLGINATKAELLVEDANSRIFKELQRRAFSTTHDSDGDAEASSIVMPISDDPYREPIEHHEVKNIMRDEGVELIDHDEVYTPTDHEGIIPDSTPLASKVSAPQATELSYQEAIETADMRGIRQHAADLSILKTQTQSSPENILSHDRSKIESQSTIELGQSLDEKIFNEGIVTRPDHIDASPHENEIITEDGSFLEHLSEKEAS